jgi:two-component system OmpR family response regulator
MGAAPMRILLVEDNEDLGNQIYLKIVSAGLEVDKVGTVEAATLALSKTPYSLAVLDRRLPDGDGISLISPIRNGYPEARIMMLTALDAIDDRIEGLDAGADDYLTKPFSLDEMIARIRAHLRRKVADKTPPIRVGHLTVDIERGLVFVREQPALFLRRELNLIQALARQAHCVVARESLIQQVYGAESEVQEHALTALVSRVRSRFSDLEARVEIHSARGLGYLLTNDDIKDCE